MSKTLSDLKSDDSRILPEGKAEWTISPEAAIRHIRNMSHMDRLQTLMSFRRLAQGSHGGQIEAWSLFTIRGCIYPNWTDDDFRRVVEVFETGSVCATGKPLGSI